MTAILTGVSWNLIDVFIWISFMAKDDELFFMYLLAIYTASLENLFICPFINWIILFGVKF
jgi:hypothetical protein